MIVKHTTEGWEVVSHYTHGLLAAKFAECLKNKGQITPWVDVLTGILEHDDHMLDFEEKNYLTKMGTPRDFAMVSRNDEQSLEHANRVYSQVGQKSQLAALVVGRHLENIYSELAKDFKKMKDFLKEIKKLRKGQRSLYGLSQDDEDRAYEILIFCDRLSLILTRGQVPEAGREIEINESIEEKTIYLSQSDETLSVEPWPFVETALDVEFEYRVLTDSCFESSSELEKAISDAPVALRHFRFKKLS